jgi:hypothetical protein
MTGARVVIKKIIIYGLSGWKTVDLSPSENVLKWHSSSFILSKLIVNREPYGQNHGIIHHSILLERVMFNTIVPLLNPNRTQMQRDSQVPKKT